MKFFSRCNKKFFVWLGVKLLAKAASGIAAPKFSSSWSLLGTLYQGRKPVLQKLYQ